MKRWLVASLLISSALLSRRAAAPPPIAVFPASLRPAFGPAPANTKLWAFGADAPPVAQVHLQLSVGGAPVSTELEARGCCALVATRSSAAIGSASATVSAANITIQTSFTITADEDHTAPTLGSATKLDDSGGRLIIGVMGSDDVGLAGFFARAEGSERGATPPNYLLTATPGADGCVSVVAVDLAGNESAARSVCGAPADPPDAGVVDGGDPGPDEGCGCRAAKCGGLAGPWALLLAGALFSRRSKLARSARRRSDARDVPG